MPRRSAPTVEEMEEVLSHAQRNSESQTLRADNMEAERDYWMARAVLAEEVVEAARQYVSGTRSSDALMQLLSTGRDFVQRRQALEVSRQQEAKRRRDS